jgi:sRNA-binding protein
VSNGATKAETAVAELVVAFPATFTLDPTLVRPLKLGIKDDSMRSPLFRAAVSRRRCGLIATACTTSGPVRKAPCG